MMAMVDVVSYLGSSLSAWSKGRQPSGAALHSSHEPDVRCPCSDFMDILRCLINCRIIIIINVKNLPV